MTTNTEKAQAIEAKFRKVIGDATRDAIAELKKLPAVYHNYLDLEESWGKAHPVLNSLVSFGAGFGVALVGAIIAAHV